MSFQLCTEMENAFPNSSCLQMFDFAWHQGEKDQELTYLPIKILGLSFSLRIRNQLLNYMHKRRPPKKRCKLLMCLLSQRRITHNMILVLGKFGSFWFLKIGKLYQMQAFKLLQSKVSIWPNQRSARPVDAKLSSD